MKILRIFIFIAQLVALAAVITSICGIGPLLMFVATGKWIAPLVIFVLAAAGFISWVISIARLEDCLRNERLARQKAT